MVNVKKMFKEYADNELRGDNLPLQGPLREGGNRIVDVRKRERFKYLGVERLSDMELPFLVDLPNGSCEAVFVIAEKNAGSGLVPILE